MRWTGLHLFLPQIEDNVGDLMGGGLLLKTLGYKYLKKRKQKGRKKYLPTLLILLDT
jgi:hypothetical protein